MQRLFHKFTQSTGVVGRIRNAQSFLSSRNLHSNVKKKQSSLPRLSFKQIAKHARFASPLFFHWYLLILYSYLLMNSFSFSHHLVVFGLCTHYLVLKTLLLISLLFRLYHGSRSAWSCTKQNHEYCI